MELKIAENIRMMRKERHLTQEQLAEAMGVSIGAVSKWEQGGSAPDLLLIVSLAQFFETSVDVLLGYGWEAGSMGAAVNRLRAFGKAKQYQEGMAFAEQSLQKYPNSFPIVYRSAWLYARFGFEHGDAAANRRGLELFEQSLLLIAQNTDEGIHELSIRNDIAQLHLQLGETDLALAELKKNNANGINDGNIGMILSNESGREKEALRYLSDALLDNIASLINNSVGFSNVFAKQKRYREALTLLQTVRTFTNALQQPNRISYLVKTDVVLLTTSAVLSMQDGQADAAKSYLQQARQAALRFDASPVFGVDGIRYLDELPNANVADDFGETAMAGIDKMVQGIRDELPQLAAIWQAVKEASREA